MQFCSSCTLPVPRGSHERVAVLFSVTKILVWWRLAKRSASVMSRRHSELVDRGDPMTEPALGPARTGGWALGAGARVSTRVVLAALAGNLVFALIKFSAFALTRSTAMLTEAVHSLVDTADQSLLLVGQARGGRHRTRATRLDMAWRPTSGPSSWRS
jgi:Cation efflux family